MGRYKRERLFFRAVCAIVCIDDTDNDRKGVELIRKAQMRGEISEVRRQTLSGIRQKGGEFHAEYRGGQMLRTDREGLHLLAKRYV